MPELGSDAERPSSHNRQSPGREVFQASPAARRSRGPSCRSGGAVNKSRQPVGDPTVPQGPGRTFAPGGVRRCRRSWPSRRRRTSAMFPRAAVSRFRWRRPRLPHRAASREGRRRLHAPKRKAEPTLPAACLRSTTVFERQGLVGLAVLDHPDRRFGDGAGENQGFGAVDFSAPHRPTVSRRMAFQAITAADWKSPR